MGNESRVSSIGGSSAHGAPSSLFKRLNSSALKDLPELDAIKALINDALEKRTKHLDKVH